MAGWTNVWTPLCKPRRTPILIHWWQICPNEETPPRRLGYRPNASRRVRQGDGGDDFISCVGDVEIPTEGLRSVG
jgi:hypothetical protein